ncbi:hypothetical protein D3C74_183310 [compost metagenome]
MKSECITKDEARQFLVNYHNLNGSQHYCGSEGVVQYFTKVRSIQYDPLHVVGRNADLVLQSKITDYKPELLQKLLYKEHILVDGFDKEMCIYLSEDYSRFERIRTASGMSTKNTLAHRNQLDALEILDDVRDHIRKNGAIGSKDISISMSQKNENRWGHKKLSSAALDYLYTIGELCVVNKNGTQKQYDFTDNVLPSHLLQPDPFKDEDEFLLWYIKRRIGSVGMVWDKRGGAWQGHFLSDKDKRERTLHELCEAGEIIRVYVEDINTPFYIKKGDEHHFTSSGNNNQVRFLAPLDNVLWDREMVKQLFDFEYRWEVYTPAEKRKYGYYVLPVLYGDQLIARFEPEKMNTKTPFTIKNWWWEPGMKVTNDLHDSIHTAIYNFSRYLGTECLEDYSNVI